MENEMIPRQTEQKIITDLERMIKSGKKGSLLLSDYVDDNWGACMDFAMLYEASDDLGYFVNQQREQGVSVKVEEDRISVL